ncbi:mCG145292, partial [Mus musculus]
LSPLSFSGQSSLCRQALLFQGRCTVIWCLDLLLAEDEGPKQDLSQKLCCFGQEGGRLSGAEDGAASEALWLSPVPETVGLCFPHLHRCSLPSAGSRSQGGSRRGLRHKPLGPGGPLCSHQEGGRLSGAEDGAASEALWLSPVRLSTIEALRGSASLLSTE